MKARTLKELIGWYASRRKGPRTRKPTYAPHIQSGPPQDMEDLHWWLAQDLAEQAGGQERLEKWLRLACRSDGAGWSKAVETDKRLRAASEHYEECGLIERDKPGQIVKETWQNENPPMEKVTTAKLVDQAAREAVDRLLSGSHIDGEGSADPSKNSG